MLTFEISGAQIDGARDYQEDAFLITHLGDSDSEGASLVIVADSMGCTLVAAVMENKFIRWVSVGDSHLYLIRKNELNKKNADHSYGGFLDRMAAEGTPVEPEADFSRNMLMSALTGQDIPEIDCPETPLELEAGDRLIVASDGLDSLSQGKILSLSNDATNPKDCVDALLEGVEEAKTRSIPNTRLPTMTSKKSARNLVIL